MKFILLSILITSSILYGYAQDNYTSVLQLIEQNSTTLNALREQMEADKLNNRTDIFLSNPEAEFGYLWGSPSAIGTRTDFSIKQDFDFPTVYKHKSKLSKMANANAELVYKSERLNLLLSAQQVCIELVYYNALAKEYVTRLENAERIAKTYKAMLDKGDTNIIESNKAQMNLTAVENEVARIETERTSLLMELKRLNGGKDIQFANSEYSGKLLPLNFEDWYTTAESKSPMLQYVSGQIEISKQQIKVNKAMGLPKFSAGYMSEKVGNEKFQGVSVGISIPLWENKNRVKQAKAQARATEIVLDDNKVQFYNKLRNLYTKASNLQKSASKYRNALATFSNDSLLKKALDAGEISLLNYLLEIEFYYDGVNNVLEAEKDLELAKAELSAVEL